jgi:hypothetical protein
MAAAIVLAAISTATTTAAIATATATAVITAVLLITTSYSDKIFGIMERL